MSKQFLFFLFLILLSGKLFAWNTLTDSVDISCNQIKNNLSCDYRSLQGEPVSISANAGNRPLLTTNEKQFSETTDKMAILFLVDTSDPGRQNVITKNKEHIKQLLTFTNSEQLLGLANFDKMLNVQAPIGTSAFLLAKSLDKLKATGRTTELYRNLLQAILQLKSADAKRKVILLFSDGQAEDKAYFHSDVIKVARKNGVVINSIGYPRSVSLSVALQTLRRLSEETGGSYIETDINYNLPDNYFNSAFNNIENGGNFTVDLSGNQSRSVAVTFATGTDKTIVKIPVKPDVIKKAAATTTPAQDKKATTTTQVSTPVTTNTAPIQVITRPVESQPVNLWLWYGLPAAFIVIIIFILIVLFLLWHRPQSSKNKSSASEYRPYGYLIANDEVNTRYPITRTIWRIGRGKDNELTLDDTSISRRHAEIHRNNNGTFDIIDLNSMNGIYINNEKVGKAILQEGDVIEIGDIFLHFTQLGADHSVEDSTVMQKTKLPH